MKPLVVKNLKKSYGKFEAVKGINFEIGNNEIFALIGPNGAGKSTTLKTIATLLTPSDGQILVYGEDISEKQEKAREFISYLPEEAGAYKRLSGKEYLKLLASLYSDDDRKIKEFYDRGVAIANLGLKINDKIATYSKGMTRKILLARALMVMPKLAILDEPTSGLDVTNAIYIRNIIKEYAKKGMAVLLSSHNMLEIEYLSDRVAIIDKGTIYETGTAKELKLKHKADNLEEVFIKVASK